MQRLFGIGIATTAATIAFAGCSGGGSNPGNGGGAGAPTAPPVVTESYAFPASAASAPAGTAWAITGLKTTLSGQFGTGKYDTLTVALTFAQNVANALPAPGASLSTGSQLGAQVFIDSDANESTGGQPSCNLAYATLEPFEYFSDAGNPRLSDGNYSIDFPGGQPIADNSGPASEAVTSVSGNVLTQSFYLPAIDIVATTSPPKIGIAAAAFNGAQSMGVDCVPIGSKIEVLTNQNIED